MACFNCEGTNDVRLYSFDLDLPDIPACPHCIFALGQGDQELLDAFKPRRSRRGTAGHR